MILPLLEHVTTKIAHSLMESLPVAEPWHDTHGNPITYDQDGNRIPNVGDIESFGYIYPQFDGPYSPWLYPNDPSGKGRIPIKFRPDGTPLFSTPPVPVDSEGNIIDNWGI